MLVYNYTVMLIGLFALDVMGSFHSKVEICFGALDTFCENKLAKNGYFDFQGCRPLVQGGHSTFS